MRLVNADGRAALINAGDELVTSVEGLGSMRHTFVDGPERKDAG